MAARLALRLIKEFKLKRSAKSSHVRIAPSLAYRSSAADSSQYATALPISLAASKKSASLRRA